MVGIVIGVLIIFALIAAIFGREKAQGAFHAVFGTLGIAILIGITIAAPPIGLGVIGFVAFIYFCKWAANDARARAERIEREQQAARAAHGIAQMQGMLNYVNAVGAKVNALSSPSSAASQATPPPTQFAQASVAVPPRLAVAPPPVQSPLPTNPMRNGHCIHCGLGHAPAQRFCADCGAALTSS